MEISSTLFSIFPEAAIVSSVYKDGRVVTSEKIIPVERVLFDSGALQASYVSSSFVEKYKEYFKLAPVNGSICMADNKTKIPVTNIAHLDVEFESNDATVFRANIQFVVFDTSGHDMIIGLPHIVMHFLPMFCDMLHDGLAQLNQENYSAEMSGVNFLGEVASTPEYARGIPLVNPWSNMPEISPEEANDLDPSCFRGPLHFMEMTPDEAREEYLGMLDEHIDPAFAAAVPVREYLASTAYEAFVKSEWTGVNGVKPIELEFH